LWSGPPAFGKTVLGLHFAFEGARRGEGTLFATFDENPSQLARAAASFGWSFDAPGLALMYRSAVDLYLDEWVYDLLDLIESRGIRRVFIDGLSNLRVAAQGPVRFHEYLYSLVQRCARKRVSVMMSLESHELFGMSRLGEVPLSQVADNVILLQFVRRGGEYRRGLTVLKSRSARTEPRLSEYTISSSGIELRRPGEARRAR
jgi:circadian clock protein KaiC